MKRTLVTVFDDIGEWSNSYGTFYSVSGIFDDGSILQANKKERHLAQELRETLLQVLDIECDYYCDDKGQSKSGNQKWALKAILDVEGGTIYGKPPQNVGVRESQARPTAPSASAAGPSAPTTYTDTKEDDIRWSVALKAAANARPGQPADVILDLTRIFFEKWHNQTSEPEANIEVGEQPGTSPSTGSDSSVPAGRGSAPVGGRAGAGADSSSASSPPGSAEDAGGVSSPPPEDDSHTPPAQREGGQGFGEGSCPPHDPDPSVPPNGMGRAPCLKCGAYVRGER